MITIWKYEVPIEDDEFTIDLPKHAIIHSFQLQKGVPMIWCRVDTHIETTKRAFRLFGTGHDLGEIYQDSLKNIYWKFIGTIQLREGNLVFHLFEKVMN